MSFLLRALIVTYGMVLCSVPGRGVVGEDVLPQADWISVNPPAEDAKVAFFRKSFTAPPRVVKAALIAACAGRMVVFLNGERVAEVAGSEHATTCDVTPALRSGQNVMAIRLQSDGQLPVMRLMLELAAENGRQTWVVSDSTWSASVAEDDGWERLDFPRGRDWRQAFGYGESGVRRWGNPFHATRSPDAYNSWMLATGALQATDPATITVPPDFQVELLRSAQSGEDSWIGLAFDPRGRITIACELRGLLRFTLGRKAVEKVERIDDTLLECRGLLYASGSLYVNANNSKGFYRLRENESGDGFGGKQLLLETRGGVGHGRNHVTLGPDGMLYLVHGNDVELPADFAAGSPLAHFAPDQLFPERWGEHGSTDFVRPPHGHVLQTDADGRRWRLFAGGLRNALDVAFNEDGEMFTYDADNERDIAAPWYRPTRVLHIIPGGEYGWRPGAGKWPAYLPDSLPSAVDIGVGSPCGIEFGMHSRFPERFRRALFIADWAYGRILAVQLTPRGATYSGQAEPFISGRPLNVTDIAFGPDGALYFVTGGRRTQSGLYRVSYRGEERVPTETIATTPTPERALRQRLERLGDASTGSALAIIWPALRHTDHWVRTAARIALEHQPLEEWEEKAFAETETNTLLTAMLSVARVGSRELQPRINARLLQLPLSALTDAQKLWVVRIYEVGFARAGRPASEDVASVIAQLEPFYPAATMALNHELCRLLTYLRAPNTIAKTMPLLASTERPEDLLHYLWHLRHYRDGWTLEQRKVAFQALRRAEQHQGARDYLQALRDVRRDLLTALSTQEIENLREAVSPASPNSPLPAVDVAKYQFRRAWTMADFSPEELRVVGSAAEGREAFLAAQCVLCHRVGRDPGGTAGPDLSGVGSRFGRRDLLEQVVEPSKVIDDKYRTMVVTMKDGTTYAGLLESEDEEKLRLSIGTTVDDVITVEKSSLLRREFSSESSMPRGLLNILNNQQIVSLLTYLQGAP